MSLTILVVGKKHEDWVATGIERYQKRLRSPYDVEWVLLPHSSLDGDRARQEESERILSRLSSGDTVVLLDERGVNIDSPSLASRIEEWVGLSNKVVFIIGGAYGVDVSVHSRAQFIWSLSKLVFPHQLVRLLLTEQLYRAQQISQGGKYHHD